MPKLYPIASGPIPVERLEAFASSAGMVSHLRMGSGSCVHTEGCNGVSQEQLELYTQVVADWVLRNFKERLTNDITEHIFLHGSMVGWPAGYDDAPHE